MTKIKNKYFILFSVLLMAIILTLPFLSPIKSSANANISQGFLNEYNLPVGSKLNDVELKFDTEKEPYKSGRNLLNTHFLVSKSFVATEDGFFQMRDFDGTDNRFSSQASINLTTGIDYVFSCNIIDHTVLSENIFMFSVQFFDFEKKHLGSSSDFSIWGRTADNSLGFYTKVFNLPKDASFVRLVLSLDDPNENVSVTLSSLQIEQGDTASAYVPYYYAPAVNGVRLFTDSKGGYLGYKIFDNVITYGYFQGQKEIIFWANDRIDNKGIFHNGWQMTNFKFNEFLEEETNVLLYHDNYGLHYRDTVYISNSKTAKKSENWLDTNLKEIFGEGMDSGKFFTYAILVIGGVIVVKKSGILK